tara:strand:+ start:1443 stop:1805 length:363 start_codon:yes stop_codon:yes gene_type:complete
LTSLSHGYRFIKDRDIAEKKGISSVTEKRPFPPPASLVRRGDLTKIFRIFFMNAFMTIKTSLKNYPADKQLDIAVLLAAHFAELFIKSDKYISGGYARKFPIRKEITLAQIVKEIGDGAV